MKVEGRLMQARSIEIHQVFANKRPDTFVTEYREKRQRLTQVERLMKEGRHTTRSNDPAARLVRAIRLCSGVARRFIAELTSSNDHRPLDK